MSFSNKKSEKIVYQGKIIEVVEETFISNEKEVVLEKGRRSPGIRLIIETPEGSFLMNKEERFGVGIDYRLAGGKVFNSLALYNEFLKREDSIKEIEVKIKEAAINEAREEVGILPLEMKKFCISPCGGSFEWDLHYFIVTKYEYVGQNLEEHEKIESVALTKDEILEKIFNGEMKEDRSIVVFLKYLNFINERRN